MDYEELQRTADEERAKREAYPCRIFCCASTPCLASGGSAVHQQVEAALTENGLRESIEVVPTGCMGPCSRGPLITVVRQGEPDVVYEHVTPDIARQIVTEHIIGGVPVASAALPATLPFFAKQKKVVLANSGQINPEKLEDYLARGGYQALSHVLREMTPEQVCDTVTQSGLRGRGGAGYPSGIKWQLVRKARGDRKFVVANGDEGDPGAYMDRTLMESDPHRVLEGMAIAGYAVGAEQGYLYVRGEYPIAARRLEKAIRAAERKGLLGTRILNSAFNFRIDVRIGAGAFVCGEETALLQSIMGRRGQPVPRPPYPSEHGLWGCPTLINNVETFGNIVPIMKDGAEQYASIGTEKSKGTKIFALAGKVNTTGLIEIPMGMSLREIIFDIGGGIPNGRAFKAAQTGGPSGGCIPADYLDTSVEYDTLRALGSIMGSGGLIIMDDQSCMPDVAKYFIDFCADESCGKCVPCRVGTVELHRILERITSGNAQESDLAELEELCQMVQDTSLCGLGQSAPNPILSTLRYFRDEYLAHIRDHKCPAGVCTFNSPDSFSLVAWIQSLQRQQPTPAGSDA